MNKIKILVILIVSSLLVYSCKEDEIAFKKADPSGGMADTYLKVDANYLDNTTHTLSEVVSTFNNDAKASYTINFSIDESTVKASFKGAVTLVNNSVEVKDRKTIVDILKVDFSKIAPGLTDTITLNVSSDDITLGKTTILNVAIIKEALPIIKLGNATYNYTHGLKEAEDSVKVIDITLKVFDKPLLEDVNIPLKLSPGTMVLGDHFDMDTIMHVKKDSVNWHFTLKVDGSFFGVWANPKTLKVEVLEAKIPPTAHVKVSDKLWVKYTLGIDWDWLYLNIEDTLDAQVEFVDTTALTKLTMIIAVGDVAIQDYNINLTLDESNIKRGIHVEIPNTMVYCKKGTDYAKLDIYVYGAAFAAGTKNILKIKMYQNQFIPLDQERLWVDTDWYWQAIWVGRKEKPAK